MKNCFGKLIIRGAYNLSIAVDKAPKIMGKLATILGVAVAEVAILLFFLLLSFRLEALLK